MTATLSYRDGAEVGPRVSRLLRGLGSSPVASTAYSTAHAAMLDQGSGLRDPALRWLRTHQHADGSWGGALPCSQDRLVSTLAAILALRQSGDGESRAAVSRALTYVQEHAADRHPASEQLVSFEAIMQSLLAQARMADLPLPYGDFTGVDTTRGHRASADPAIAEAFTSDSVVAFADITRLVSPDGSLWLDPAATSALHRATGHPLALSHLRRAAACTDDGGLPGVSSLDIFEPAWALSLLQRARILPPAGPTTPPARALMEAALGARQHGVGPDSRHPVPDADHTGMALIALQNLGYDTTPLLSALIAFSDRVEEQHLSTAGNARILEVLHHHPEQHSKRLSKATDFLLGSRIEGAYWHDSRHLSPYYATAQALFGLTPSHCAELAATYRWLLDSQHPNGSWGSDGGQAEETAYAVLALRALQPHFDGVPTSVWTRARDFLRDCLDIAHYPEMWIGKVLYEPTSVVRAAVLAGYATAAAEHPLEGTAIPSSWTRFPCGNHPQGKEINARSLEWMDAHGLVSDPDKRARLHRSRLGEGTADSYTTAGPQYARLTADMYLWLTSYDDVFAETEGQNSPERLGRLICELIDVLDGNAPPPQAHGHVVALHDLMLRGAQLMRPQHLERVISGISDFLFATLLEANTPRDTTDTTEQIARTLRRHSSSGMLAARLIDRPDSLVDDPRVARLEAAKAELLGWINDFASYQHERDAGTTGFGLLDILSGKRRCSVPEAFVILARMWDDKAEQAYRDLAELAASADPDHRAYADSMAYLIGTGAYWHLARHRY